jgi:hypothetical protein
MSGESVDEGVCSGETGEWAARATSLTAADGAGTDVVMLVEPDDMLGWPKAVIGASNNRDPGVNALASPGGAVGVCPSAEDVRAAGGVAPDCGGRKEIGERGAIDVAELTAGERAGATALGMECVAA